MTRRVTQAGIELIKRYEGFRAKPYLCPANYWTIGYGHVIKHKLELGEAITLEHAEQLLRVDVSIAARAVDRLCPVELYPNQFDALVSFAFNLGAGALQRSTLRRKVLREEHEDVPAELAKWVYGGGRKLPGLVKRRAAEAELYEQHERPLPWL